MYLLRNNKFLNERYQWVIHPHAFSAWQFQAVLDLAVKFPDPATHIGEMVDGELQLFDLKKG